MRVDGYDDVHRLEVGGTVAFVALHAVLRGRAFGGVRIKRYDTERAALDDALALARAMSRKVVMAGIPGGGAKTVIMEGGDRTAAVRSVGEYIESLGGRYCCGADYGFTPADDAVLRSATKYVACGDLAPATARTVVLAMRAIIDARVVAIQGLGAVGRPIAEMLKASGVRVIGSDVKGGDLEPGRIYDVECDVFAPCALGDVLDDATIPRLKCKVVCGAANNPLAVDGDELRRRGIVYVPDFIANSGATIKGASTTIGEGHLVESRLNAVGPLVKEIVNRAAREGRSPQDVAVEIADERIAALRQLR